MWILFLGKIEYKKNKDFSLTDEIISKGPQSFIKNPTAIKIGRAVFVPFILLSWLYDRNKNSK